MPILKTVLAGAVAPAALVLSSISLVLVSPAPGHAENTAEQRAAPAAGGDDCDDAAANVTAPRDAASGQASGKRTAAPACDHAINTKGTGAAGKAAGPGAEPRDCDDDDDGAAERSCLAIKTKGTSAQRSGPGGADCDDDSAADRTAMAIKSKGTGAQRGGVSVAAGDVDGDGVADVAAEACDMAINEKGPSVR